MLRVPDSLPYPHLPPGTDTIEEIAHVVVLVMENHSFDNLLGMLGRGDGFQLGRDGRPTATNPYADGRTQHAFRMPTTCQLSSAPTQEWAASHESYDEGRMDGFVRASGGVAMGYWTKEDLPFTYSLVSTFPLADRWFCSVLGQTDPNRRYVIAGTSAGLTDDISTSPAIGGAAQNAVLAQRANGTIFERLSDKGIDWLNYAAAFPLGATPELFPAIDTTLESTHRRPFDRFFTDAASGALPGFSFLDENYNTQSEENPQNIVVGEAMLARVVHALGDGPGWRRSLLIVTYDEHGGYYDHVPPPVALAPDSLPPVVAPGESTYDGFKRYGIRVPGLIVSPYARQGHVSHVIFDHTSVLAFVERKWNLPAMTYRDANANDLTDLVDLNALAARRPTFPVLPRLAAPGDTAEALACSTSGPGTVPPPQSISPAA
jgi:phospholipase C